MSRIPFSTYDFFAYLSSGSLVVAAVDVLYGRAWLLEPEIRPLLALVLLLLAYITGQVVAQLSAPILEKGLLHGVMRPPSENLMRTDEPWGRYLFPLFYKPLPEKNQVEVRTQMQARNFAGSGEELFIHIFGVVKRLEGMQDRLDGFRNQYGLARNMCFAFLVVTLLVLVGPLDDARDAPSRWWALVSCGFGVAMLYRYLKFFRQYSYELFVTYAGLPVDNPAPMEASS